MSYCQGCADCEKKLEEERATSAALRAAVESARAMIGDMLMAHEHGAPVPTVTEEYAQAVDRECRDALNGSKSSAEAHDRALTERAERAGRLDAFVAALRVVASEADEEGRNIARTGFPTTLSNDPRLGGQSAFNYFADRLREWAMRLLGESDADRDAEVSNACAKEGALAASPPSPEPTPLETHRDSWGVEGDWR